MSTNMVAEMLEEWKQAQLRADLLREQITAIVLETQETIETLEVIAKFNPEKHYHDYQLAVDSDREAKRFLVRNFLKVQYLDPSIYHRVCDVLGLEAPVSKIYAPTVTLRVK